MPKKSAPKRPMKPAPKLQKPGAIPLAEKSGEKPESAGHSAVSVPVTQPLPVENKSLPLPVKPVPPAKSDVGKHPVGQGTIARANTNVSLTPHGATLKPVGEGLHLLVEPEAIQIRNMLRDTPWLISAAMKLHKYPLEGFAFLLSTSLTLTNTELLMLLNEQIPDIDDPLNSASNLSDAQIYNIYLAASDYLQGDLAPNTGISPYDYIMANIPIPVEMRSQILEARQRYLNALFIQTAAETNLSELTNMSDQAMAAFMLSQTRLEPGNWDGNTDIIGYGSNHPYPQPIFVAGAQAAHFLATVSARFPFLRDVYRAIDTNTTRLDGSSLGIPNIFPQMYFEALEFANRLVQNPDSYSADIGHFNLEVFSVDNVELAINHDPTFAMRGLALIMNWAGARQMINRGAGNTDIPAIREGNFGIITRDAPVSAFSLAHTRYSDSVSGVGWSQVASSTEFIKMIEAVEGTYDAASRLGFSMGEGESDIVLGRDFTPYTQEEAREIVHALVCSENLAVLDRSPLLQHTYEQYGGNLSSVECTEPQTVNNEGD